MVLWYFFDSSDSVVKEQDGDCSVISTFGTLVFWYFGIFGNFIFWYFCIFFDSSDSVVKEQDGEEGRGVLVVDR